MSMFWSVPLLWPGETCAVLASGPSMNGDVADAVRNAGCRAIAVCRTVELAPWADMVYAADMMWWSAFRSQLKSFRGLKVTCEQNTFDDVLQLKIGKESGFSEDPAVINTGGNSGYQAICIAAHAGAKRILLCGFDMRGKHWHPEYRSPLKTHEEDSFLKWLPRFETLREPLAKRGIEVINCTPGSSLTVWPIVSLQEALGEKSDFARWRQYLYGSD